ncbi:hypothetical protein [Nocardia sp. CDC160]|uniref:hypothetical protein n=1 Tax=Nocardia sp. CDC160 TaxID=3112166 RepID=UPI002DB6082C|nr:hypothetical protein [Nocardia sp. CDC160]MEC3919105.1 hypothetical protein [Nocardia sp. CDC160]
MQRCRPVLGTAAAALAAAVACLALIVPVDTGCADTASSALQMTLLTITVPRATAAGAVVAVLVAVVVAMFGARTAWATATVAALILATDHLLVTGASASLATANFVDSLAAGMLLGAVGAVALENRPPAIGYLLGALTGILVGDHLENATEIGSRSLLERAYVDLPPSWLTIPTAVLLAVCFLVWQRPGTAAYPTTLNLPFGPVLGAAVLITTITVAAERFADTGANPAAMAVGVLVTLAAALVAVLLLPGRDGTLTLLMVALAAGGSAITYGARQHWQVAPMLIVMTACFVLGRVRPAPLAAATAILALGVFDMLTSTAEQSDWLLSLIGSCAVSGIAGYGFGAVATRTAAGTVLPLGLLLIPSAVLTLEFRGCGPTPWHHHDNVLGDRPAWFALGLGFGCLLGILALRRWRPGYEEGDPGYEDGA